MTSEICDVDGFGPVIADGSAIAPCFSQLILEPILYIIFLIYTFHHFKAIQTLPNALLLRHSSKRLRLKIILSVLQTIYPTILTIAVVLGGMYSSFSFARFFSYAFRTVVWLIATFMIITEYFKALPQDKTIRNFWLAQLVVDAVACFVPHGGDKELLSFLSTMNFFLSAGLALLSLWPDDINLSVFRQNKEISDNREDNYYWHDFHDYAALRDGEDEETETETEAGSRTGADYSNVSHVSNSSRESTSWQDHPTSSRQERSASNREVRQGGATTSLMEERGDKKRKGNSRFQTFMDRTEEILSNTVTSITSNSDRDRETQNETYLVYDYEENLKSQRSVNRRNTSPEERQKVSSNSQASSFGFGLNALKLDRGNAKENLEQVRQKENDVWKEWLDKTEDDDYTLS